MGLGSSESWMASYDATLRRSWMKAIAKIKWPSFQTHGVSAFIFDFTLTITSAPNPSCSLSSLRLTLLMASEPAVSSTEKAAPSRYQRLCSWWFIYLFGSLYYCFFIFSPAFPIGLGDVYGYLFAWILGFFSSDYAGNEVSHLIADVCIALAYITYGVHLHLTSKATTRRVFLLLMLSLILIMSANLKGCYDEDCAFHFQ
jgi:hypothetical protein